MNKEEFIFHLFLLGFTLKNAHAKYWDTYINKDIHVSIKKIADNCNVYIANIQKSTHYPVITFEEALAKLIEILKLRENK